MQTFPVPAQTDLPNVERCDGERNEQQKSGNAEQDIRLLHDGLHEEIPGDAVIQVQEDQDVNYSHHDGVQAERPAALEQLPPAEQVAQGGAGERKHQQRDGQPTGALLDGLQRIGRQVTRDETKGDLCQARPHVDVHGHLQGSVGKAFKSLRKIHRVPDGQDVE